MKKILISCLFLSLGLSLFSQTDSSKLEESDSAIFESLLKQHLMLDLLSQNSDSIKLYIKSIPDSVNAGHPDYSEFELQLTEIRKNIELIEKNTQPESFVEKLIDDVTINLIYDFFFEDSQTSWITILSGIIGVVISLIRLIIALRKPEGRFGKATLSIFVLFLSSLLLLLTNSRVNTSKPPDISNLENKLQEIERTLNRISSEELLEEIAGLKSAIETQSNNSSNAEIQKLQLDELAAQLNSIEKNITENISNSTQEINHKIEKVNTHGFLLSVILILVIIILMVILFVNKNDLIN